MQSTQLENPIETNLNTTERQTANTWYKAIRAWNNYNHAEHYGNPPQSSSGFTIIGATRVPQPGTGTHKINYLETPIGILETDTVLQTMRNAPKPHRYALSTIRTTLHPKGMPAALLRPNTNAWTDSIHDIPALARACLWLATELEKRETDH